jgi:hypothetical protein
MRPAHAGWTLLHLERTNIGHDIVDVLLARGIARGIQRLKLSAPDRHFLRAMSGEIPTEFEQRADVTLGEFPVVAFVSVVKSGGEVFRAKAAGPSPLPAVP